MWPLIVAVLILPSFAGFALGGAAVGAAVGAATAACLVVIAARSKPREPIALAGDEHRAPLLAIALAPIEDAATANAIATLAEADGEREGYSVLVLAPAAPTAAQRWLSDEGPGRLAAQERLAVSLATLAASGCHAEGRAVSEDPREALADVAAQHGARRIVFIVPDRAHDRQIADLTERLDRPVHRIEVAADPGA
jgi:hypothetical protein